MTLYDLTQPTPEDRFDELQGHINDSPENKSNLEVCILWVLKNLKY